MYDQDITIRINEVEIPALARPSGLDGTLQTCGLRSRFNRKDITVACCTVDYCDEMTIQTSGGRQPYGSNLLVHHIRIG